MNKSVEYLVGYRENREFWAVFETNNEREALFYIENCMKEDSQGDQDLARN